MITSLPPIAPSSDLSEQRLGVRGPDQPAQPTRRRLPARPAATRHDSFHRYLPVDDHSSSYALCVTGVGSAIIRPGDPYPQSEHPNIYQLDWRSGRVLPEFQVVLLTEARGEFESRETGLVRFQGQALLFLFPGVWHRYRPDRAFGWNECWTSLNGRLAHRLFKQSGVTPASAISTGPDAPRLNKRFEQLVEVARESPACQTPAIQQAAARLLGEALGVSHAESVLNELNSSPGSEPEPDAIVEQAREVIWSCPHKRPLSVNDVARRLPVTRRTLDRRFAQVLGHSVLDEINACRLSRAKRLLVETDFLVKTVSYLAGFPSRERMRLLFLSEEGMTPTEYREQASTRC